MADRTGALGQSVVAGTADTVVGAAGGTPVLTYAASGTVAPYTHALGGVIWSLSGGTPATAGSITIADGAAVVRQWDLTTPGPGFMPFNPPLKGAAANTALVVTAYPGGTAIVAKLNAIHWTES